MQLIGWGGISNAQQSIHFSFGIFDSPKTDVHLEVCDFFFKFSIDLLESRLSCKNKLPSTFSFRSSISLHYDHYRGQLWNAYSFIVKPKQCSFENKNNNNIMQEGDDKPIAIAEVWMLQFVNKIDHINNLQTMWNFEAYLFF